MPIDRLEAYRREHGLVRHEITFLGKPGWRPNWNGSKMRFSGLGHVIIHGPDFWAEELG
ncbi:MAG: hypothetical protein GWN58_56640 [Anaerolineae bacterium]|nr:hypothetical protein [Anaerolineae bacterium]